MGKELAGDGDLGRLGDDHGLRKSWISDDAYNAFKASIKKFDAAVDEWKTANAETVKAADALTSWANVLEQTLNMAKPFIDAEVAKMTAPPAATDAAENRTAKLAEGVQKVKTILETLRPLLASAKAGG